jgi:glycosyltransferase involved in cell wall biosynthesis
MALNGISVIVCCHNSATRITPTLHYLKQQVVSETLAWEVILVDNVSVDGTADVALAAWGTPIPFVPLRIVNESQLGLSYARKKGIDSALYDCLIFCDDDNWLSTDYVLTAYNTLKAMPEVGIIGGRGLPEYEIAPPEWIRKYVGYYATGPQQSASGDITGKGFVYGAGMVARKAVFSWLEQQGIDSLLSDRRGNSLISGGDVELCFQAKMFGYKIWYLENLTFKHFIPTSRLNWQYMIALVKGFTASDLILNLYEHYFFDSFGKLGFGEYQIQIPTRKKLSYTTLWMKVMPEVYKKLLPLKRTLVKTIVMKKHSEGYVYELKLYYHIGYLQSLLKLRPHFAHINRRIQIYREMLANRNGHNVKVFQH